MLGLTERFKGNEATQWGTSHEDSAASLFHRYIDGHAEMNNCAFDVLRTADTRGRSLEWIGASPDGILMPAGSGSCDVHLHHSVDKGRHPHTSLGTAKGILEIKCPYKLYGSWAPQPICQYMNIARSPVTEAYDDRPVRECIHVPIHACRMSQSQTSSS